MQLILASSSPYRRELLERFGLPFEVRAPNVDETPLPGEAPRQLVLRLALAKARAVAAGRSDALVIGSDQAAAFAGQVVGKPGGAARAERQLREFSGRGVEFLTGLALLHAGSGRAATHVDRTTARFRQASEAEIRRYVAMDEPLDCAGAIRFEGLGPLLLDGVDTEDPTAAIGLPLIALARMLREAGLNPLG